jgi:hypothetical protein
MLPPKVLLIIPLMGVQMILRGVKIVQKEFILKTRQQIHPLKEVLPVKILYWWPLP